MVDSGESGTNRARADTHPANLLAAFASFFWLIDIFSCNYFHKRYRGNQKCLVVIELESVPRFFIICQTREEKYRDNDCGGGVKKSIGWVSSHRTLSIRIRTLIFITHTHTANCRVCNKVVQIFAKIVQMIATNLYKICKFAKLKCKKLTIDSSCVSRGSVGPCEARPNGTFRQKMDFILPIVIYKR